MCLKKNKMNKLLYLLPALFFSVLSFSQTDGFWDRERATTKEISLSAGKRALIKAEDCVLKAISMNQNEIKFQLHLAHVYLVTDRVSEAKAIHKKYKEQNIAINTSWVQATQQDFDNMKQTGLPTDHFKKILRILE